MSSAPATPPALDSAELEEFYRFLRQLGPIAHDAISPHMYGKGMLEIRAKPDQSPVTNADRQVEAAIRDAIRERYPDHRIIGEELANAASPSPYCWVIDPIDGTKAFLAGLPTYTTLVGLTYHGVPWMGLIQNPSIRERWIGCKGKKLFYEGPYLRSTMLPSANFPLKRAILGTTDPYLMPPEARASYERLYHACGYAICGGDAYLYARMASGLAPHLILEHGLQTHDLMALIPVIEAAGGIATSWSGAPITLEKHDGTLLAAQTPAIHKQALAVIAST